MSAREREIIQAAFANPLEIPPLFKGWLEAYLEPTIDEMIQRRIGQIPGFSWPAWQAYTPTWTATGTAPALNNGTIQGRYVELGKTIVFNLKLLAGNTTSFGTGTWIFSLPPSLPAGGLGQPNMPLGCTESVDVSANQNYPGQAIEGGGGIVVSTLAAPGVLYTGTVPFPWTNTDYLLISGAYETS